MWHIWGKWLFYNDHVFRIKSKLVRKIYIIWVENVNWWHVRRTTNCRRIKYWPNVGVPIWANISYLTQNLKFVVGFGFLCTKNVTKCGNVWKPSPRCYVARSKFHPRVKPTSSPNLTTNRQILAQDLRPRRNSPWGRSAVRRGRTGGNGEGGNFICVSAKWRQLARSCQERSFRPFLQTNQVYTTN